jgi:hypothetical protein
LKYGIQYEGQFQTMNGPPVKRAFRFVAMKNYREYVVRSAACAMVIFAALVGCEQSTAPVKPVSASKPQPEASFEIIASTFERRVEGTPSGFVAPQAGGHSRLVASSNVTSELKPPATAGEPYRGTITVVSKSRYSLARTGDDADQENGDDQAGKERSDGAGIDDPANASGGVEIDDPAVVRPASGEGGRRLVPDEGAVARRFDQTERIFELEHQDGRWVLLTKPDPETERSIQSAFEEALNTQF